MRPPSQRAAHRNYSACLQVMFGLGTPTPSKAMFALSTLERSNVDTSLIQTLAAESNCDVGVPMSFVLLSEDTGARTIVSSRCGLKEVQLHIVLLLACCSSFSCMKGQGESVMRFVLTNSSESILQVKTIKNIQKLFWMACFWVHNAPTLDFLQRLWLATNLQATAPPPLTTLLTTHHNHHASQPASNNSHRNDRCCLHVFVWSEEMDPAHFQDVLAKSKDLWHLLALQSVVIIWYVCQPSSDSQTSLVVKNTAELIERAIERGARD